MKIVLAAASVLLALSATAHAEKVCSGQLKNKPATLMTAQQATIEHNEIIAQIRRDCETDDIIIQLPFYLVPRFCDYSKQILPERSARETWSPEYTKRTPILDSIYLDRWTCAKAPERSRLDE